MVTLYTIHLEVRLALESCARTHRVAKTRCRNLSTFPPLRARNRGTSRAIQHAPPANSVKPSDISDTPKPSTLQSDPLASSRSNSTKLVPRIPKPASLQDPRRSDIPARLLPKAQISPGLILSPKERLQIEYETRRPPKTPEKPGEHEEMCIMAK